MESYSDDELLYLFRCGNQQAEECLFDRYYKFVYKWLLPYKNYQMQYYDYTDLMQIAMFNLPRIIDNYRDDQKTSLRTYAKLAIRRRLSTVVSREKEQCFFRKYKCLELDNYIKSEDELRYSDIIADPCQKNNPEISLLIKEEESRYNAFISEKVSPLEIEIMDLLNQGYNQNEIAEFLKISIKSVYNAIYRYHKKVEGIDVRK